MSAYFTAKNRDAAQLRVPAAKGARKAHQLPKRSIAATMPIMPALTHIAAKRNANRRLKRDLSIDLIPGIEAAPRGMPTKSGISTADLSPKYRKSADITTIPITIAPTIAAVILTSRS